MQNRFKHFIINMQPTTKKGVIMTIIYQNQAYRFIGYANLPGTEITAEKGGKFYRLPVTQCRWSITKLMQHTK
jgi:hypothetical protein